jgi:regulator of nucleoside diphosphate kinase
MTAKPNILVTETDERRISHLLATKAGTLNPRVLAQLEDELGRATIVASSEIPPNVVTMNSAVSFENVESGERSEVTLVYPSATSGAEGHVSILAPIGAALLGLTVGDSIEWPMPNGTTRNLRVTAVRFQPEAAGNLDL